MTTHITLIPGAAGLASFWDPVRAELPPEWQQRSLDLPGIGPVPAQPHIQSFDHLVEHIARGCRAPGIVAGQSMGGYLALQLALRHPQLVTHLALIVTAAGLDMARHGVADWRPSHRGEHQNAEWVYAPAADVTDQLSCIRVPTVLIWATRDRISPLSVGQTLAAAIPRARLLTFDSDDHWVARRFARETAAAIQELHAGPPRAGARHARD